METFFPPRYERELIFVKSLDIHMKRLLTRIRCPLFCVLFSVNRLLLIYLLYFHVESANDAMVQYRGSRSHSLRGDDEEYRTQIAYIGRVHKVILIHE